LQHTGFRFLLALMFLLAIGGQAARVTAAPLSVLASNPRYFTNGTGRAIALSGSHTWDVLQDSGVIGQPVTVFDYSGFLNFLLARHHNFFRFWMAEGWWASSSGLPDYSVPPYYTLLSGTVDVAPLYDTGQWNQAYFDRMRQRVIAARDSGIYVALMLFQGWSIDGKGFAAQGNPWPGHAFEVNNNVNGINGDPNNTGQGLSTHTLQIPAITALQDAYVKKVIDTVNDLDNVLYEVSNEDPTGAGDTKWQYHVITLIHTYEATTPGYVQHPVGMTVQWSGSFGANSDLYNSPAEWVSPANSSTEDYSGNPPPATGVKVILPDTDHLSPRPSDYTWVWKSFTRGLNPIYMDDLSMNAGRETFRLAMGDILEYAAKMNLAAMTPQGGLSSTGYALASRSEYCVFQPGSGAFWLKVSKKGVYTYEWLNPATHAIVATGSLSVNNTNNSVKLTPLFRGPAVLYLKG